MREIKFKGYWKNNEDIYLVVDPDYIDCRGKTYDYFDGMEEDKNYVLSQFTGLKDKNGVEIYEGDIVKYLQRNLSAALGLERGRDFKEEKRVIRYSEQSFNVPQGFIRELEVIGNIYENPELVTK